MEVERERGREDGRTECGRIDGRDERKDVTKAR